MRPKLPLRKSRPIHLGAGALLLAIPASAVALSANQADAQSALQVTLQPHAVGYGDDVTVSGNASAQAAGQPLELEFAPAGSARWRALQTTKVNGNGRFELVTPLRRSGLVRVLSPSTIAASASQPVTVAAELNVLPRSRDVLAGQATDVRGRLLPGLGGRRLRLQGHANGAWRTLASARTGRYGGFDLHYVPSAPGQRRLRVRFDGDHLNARSAKGAGQLTVYAQSVASWYDDAGSTACGFHATYGVANKDVPCGTKVTVRYGGRKVTATVDDRGPYVAGRDWDLNQNTAGALGFSGVATVWSSM